MLHSRKRIKVHHDIETSPSPVADDSDSDGDDRSSSQTDLSSELEIRRGRDASMADLESTRGLEGSDNEVQDHSFESETEDNNGISGD